jgi:hypothetical protein
LKTCHPLTPSFPLRKETTTIKKLKIRTPNNKITHINIMLDFKMAYMISIDNIKQTLTMIIVDETS